MIWVIKISEPQLFYCRKDTSISVFAVLHSVSLLARLLCTLPTVVFLETVACCLDYLIRLD